MLKTSELVRTKFCHFSKIKMHVVRFLILQIQQKVRSFKLHEKLIAQNFLCFLISRSLEPCFRCFGILIKLFKTWLYPLSLKFLRIQDWQSRMEYQGLSFEELSIYLQQYHIIQCIDKNPLWSFFILFHLNYTNTTCELKLQNWKCQMLCHIFFLEEIDI